MKLPRWTNALYVVTNFGLLAVPVAVAVQLIAYGPLFGKSGPIAGVMPSEDAQAWQLWAATGVGSLSMLAVLWAMFEMRALLGLYRQGLVLTAAAATRINRMGSALCLAAVAPLVVVPIQSVLLTLSNAPGHRQITLGISSTDFGFFLGGGLLIVIATAMRQAAELADENRAFV